MSAQTGGIMVSFMSTDSISNHNAHGKDNLEINNYIFVTIFEKGRKAGGIRPFLLLVLAEQDGGQTVYRTQQVDQYLILPGKGR